MKACLLSIKFSHQKNNNSSDVFLHCEIMSAEHFLLMHALLIIFFAALSSNLQRHKQFFLLQMKINQYIIENKMNLTRINYQSEISLIN